MKRIAPLILTALLVARVCGDQQPFDVIVNAYAPYMSPADPLAMPMKVKALTQDPYTFWRGSKDLFFVWCRANTRDWLDDPGAHVPCHGDLHFGNIGAYVPAEGWGELALGMVDFDDTALMPFQIELLQGLITLELTADHNALRLDPAQREQLAGAMLDAYRSALSSEQIATDLLRADPSCAKLLDADRPTYVEHLEKLTTNGRFRPVVFSGKGKLRDVFRSAAARQDDLAKGIAEALEHSPGLRASFRYHTPAEIRREMRDAVLRTRIGSSGSQGLKKYFVLLHRPLVGLEHDVIVYLKQQIPPAAERAGVVSATAESPGRRLAQLMSQLTSPQAFANSWCEIGGESYWVTVVEPWSNELDPGDFQQFDAVLRGARIWGTVAGAAHAAAGHEAAIQRRLTPQLPTLLLERAADYLNELEHSFEQFVTDPRTVELSRRPDQFIRTHTLVHDRPAD